MANKRVMDAFGKHMGSAREKLKLLTRVTRKDRDACLNGHDHSYSDLQTWGNMGTRHGTKKD